MMKARGRGEGKAGERFGRIPEEIYELWPQLSNRAKALCATLAFWMNKDTGSCFMSEETICQLAGWSRATLFRAKRDAQKAGAIRVEKRGVDEKRRFQTSVIRWNRASGVKQGEGRGRASELQPPVLQNCKTPCFRSEAQTDKGNREENREEHPERKTDLPKSKISNEELAKVDHLAKVCKDKSRTDFGRMKDRTKENHAFLKVVKHVECRIRCEGLDPGNERVLVRFLDSVPACFSHFAEMVNDKGTKMKPPYYAANLASGAFLDHLAEAMYDTIKADRETSAGWRGPGAMKDVVKGVMEKAGAGA